MKKAMFYAWATASILMFGMMLQFVGAADLGAPVLRCYGVAAMFLLGSAGAMFKAQNIAIKEGFLDEFMDD